MRVFPVLFSSPLQRHLFVLDVLFGYAFFLSGFLVFLCVFLPLGSTRETAHALKAKDSHSPTHTHAHRATHARSHTLTNTDAALQIFLFVLLSVFSMPPPFGFRRFLWLKREMGGEWVGEVEN